MGCLGGGGMAARHGRVPRLAARGAAAGALGGAEGGGQYDVDTVNNRAHDWTYLVSDDKSFPLLLP